MLDYTIRLFHPKTKQYSYHVYCNMRETQALEIAKADHPNTYFCGCWPYILDICKVGDDLHSGE